MAHDEGAQLFECEQRLYKHLDDHAIDYAVYEHPAVWTVAESQDKVPEIPATGTKNLFLKDRKKRYWLVTAAHTTQVDLKALARGLGTAGFYFARQHDLEERLGVKPGAVTPLSLMNDLHAHVRYVIDSKLVASGEPFGVHPLRNNATLVIAPDMFARFLESLERSYTVFDFTSNTGNPMYKGKL